jgi:hypothetical protein
VLAAVFEAEAHFDDLSFALIFDYLDPTDWQMAGKGA